MSPATPATHPGFRPLNMTALIVVDPNDAADQITTAYRRARANLRKTAEYLAEKDGKPPTERTLHRWVAKLKLRAALKKITEELAAKGELDEHRRPAFDDDGHLVEPAAKRKPARAKKRRVK